MKRGGKVAGVRTDGRVERGNQTRRLVLGRTMAIASVEGLDGLSIGRIAAELGLSKSGVFALFGSKEELQLATVRAARAVFVEHIVRPTSEVPPGLRRVRTLSEKYLEYSQRRIFPGGCFFSAAAAEFAARSGPVRDAVAAARDEWIAHVGEMIAEAQRVGDLRPDVDVAQLTFEVLALQEMANSQSALFGDDSGYERATVAIANRLLAATPACHQP